MKKILLFLFLGAVGLLVYSCDNNNNNEDFDTIAQAFDISPNFTKVKDNLYEWHDYFKRPLVQSDMLLIYMQIGIDRGAPIWQLLPYTYHLEGDNVVDYTSRFNKYAASIYINLTPKFSLTDNPSYYKNKNFRVLIIPANRTRAGVDYNNYKSVIQYYKIDESKIRTQ